MRPVVVALLVVLVASGCAADEGRRRSRSGARRAAAPAPGAMRAPAPGGDPVNPEGPAELASRTVRTDRFETIALPDPEPPAAPRPARRGRVNVDLDGAPFEDVARMLSDVGGFGLVLEAPGAGVVNASLRDVDAWDALLAIAHAKGLAVTYERGIAVVRAP